MNSCMSLHRTVVSGSCLRGDDRSGVCSTGVRVIDGFKNDLTLFQCHAMRMINQLLVQFLYLYLSGVLAKPAPFELR